MDKKHHAAAIEITRRWLSSSAKWNFGRFSNDNDSEFYNLLGLQFPLPSDLDDQAIQCIKERVRFEKKRVWRDTLADMVHSDKPDVALQAGKLLAKLPAVNPQSVNNFVITGNFVTLDNVKITNDVGEGSSKSKKRKIRDGTPPPPPDRCPAPPPYTRRSVVDTPQQSRFAEDEHGLVAKGKQLANPSTSSAADDDEFRITPLPVTVDDLSSASASDAECSDTTPKPQSFRSATSSSLGIDEATFFAEFDAMSSQCNGCCLQNSPGHEDCIGCCDHPPTQKPSPITPSLPQRDATPNTPCTALTDTAGPASTPPPPPPPAPFCPCVEDLEELKQDMREQKRRIEKQGRILKSVRKYLLLQRKAEKTLTGLLLDLQDFEDEPEDEGE